MRRITAMTSEEIIAYNLRDGGTAVTVFADVQTYRVEKARAFIRALLPHLTEPARLIELGCSAGDIVGPFAGLGHSVTGVDIVPAAVRLARERYPEMEVIEGQAELFAPAPCDVLVLTEFLEHIDDPLRLVREWLPQAQFTIIGHPLADPGGVEPGHVWSYELSDYFNWLELGGHAPIETHLFSGPFPSMVMGASRRL